MSAVFMYTLLLAMGLYLVLILVELFKERSWKRFGIEILILGGVFLLLNLTLGFPTNTVQAFGGISPIRLIGIMFVCTILGVAARYFFYLEGKFSWLDFLKPMFISPIVLLPLLGTIQGATSFETIQTISFAILSFQNGFFWKVVLENAKKQVQPI